MRGGTRLAAGLCALALAGCGGGAEEAPGPETVGLPPAVAEDLAAQSEAIASSLEAGDECGAAHEADALLASVVASVNSGDVPPPMQEELTAVANELVDEVNCPPPATVEDEDDDDDDDDDQGKGEGKGKGKKDKGDEEGETTTEEEDD